MIDSNVDQDLITSEFREHAAETRTKNCKSTLLKNSYSVASRCNMNDGSSRQPQGFTFHRQKGLDSSICLICHVEKLCIWDEIFGRKKKDRKGGSSKRWLAHDLSQVSIWVSESRGHQEMKIMGEYQSKFNHFIYLSLLFFPRRSEDP